MDAPPSRRASALDRAFLALGDGAPDALPDVGAIMYLDGPAPSLADVRQVVLAALPALPVLTHELHGPPADVRWRPVAGFDVARHLTETVADGTGRTAVLDAARQRWAGPLPAGAAWELCLLRPSSGEGWGLCYRVHHAWQDGMAIGHTLQTLFSPAGPGPSPRPAAGQQAAAPSVVRFVRAVVTSVALYGGYLRRTPNGLGGPWSLSGRRRISTAATSLPVLRAVARSAGGTVHDAYLAALAGAVRAWCEETGRTPAPLSVAVALNVRRTDEPSTWGNRCFVRRVRLPCHESDPSRRLTGTVAAAAPLKSPRVRQTAQDLLCGSSEWLVRFGFPRFLDPRYGSFVSSYVPCGEDGSAVPARLTDILPITLLPPGHPFNICLTTFRSTAQVAVVSDTAVTGAHRFPALWQQAVEELREATAVSPPAPRAPADGLAGTADGRGTA
ncbi:hypothetical protein AB0K09_29460 [Streptomyces sp. NPDC049577]|uniref:hypothetical protein n=1 Tax=Streptomyces sp. NPDC049577 TaxID=3155153 RepID=UPI003422D4D7